MSMRVLPRDRLSATFAALSDPTRRAILQRLAQGEAVVKDLALPFDISGPAISRHLTVLEKAGLVERGRDAQWRPRRLLGEPLGEAAQWLQAYRPFWEDRFDRMDAMLQADSKRRPKAKSAARTAAAPRKNK